MDIDEIQEPDQLVAAVREVVPMADMAPFFDRVFGAIMEKVSAAGGAPVAAPFGWYHGMPAAEVDVAAGFPVAGVAEGDLGDGVVVQIRPGGRALVAVHVGSYDGLADAWGVLMGAVAAKGLAPRGDFWEEYLTEPTPDGDPSTWETRLVVPVS